MNIYTNIFSYIHGSNEHDFEYIDFFSSSTMKRTVAAEESKKLNNKVSRLV